MMRMRLVHVVAALAMILPAAVAVAVFAPTPTPARAASCSQYLQGAYTNIGGGILASPQMTTPHNFTCGNVSVGGVTDANWAPIGVTFYARIRVYPSGNVGQWIFFPANCYSCWRNVTTGAWGDLVYRIELGGTQTSAAHFYGRH